MGMEESDYEPGSNVKGSDPDLKEDRGVGVGPISHRDLVADLEAAVPLGEFDIDVLAADVADLDTELASTGYRMDAADQRVHGAFDYSLTYYIAGPMTGYPEYNYPAFRAAEDILTRTGVRCLTPLQDDMALAEMDETLKWQLCMKYATGQLLAADGIILLKGWPGSKGARRELELAIDLGYPVWYYHEYQLTAMTDL